MSSDNPSGAGNQQERPGIEQWIVGFVDGEGCFSVPIHRNQRLRIGWQVQPSFAVVQGAKSVDVLYQLKEFFGCGNVYINERHDNHREHLFRYDVRRFVDLRDRIVPFFQANPLRTAKRDDFEKFVLIIRMMDDRLHLTRVGLRRIAAIKSAMNHRRPSRFLESSEAIRQPSPLGGGDEEMVLASWRHGDPASWKKLDESEIPCRVDELPREGAIFHATPANNGEALPQLERAIPWEVESLRLFDPVTTEAKAEMEFDVL